MTTPEKVRVLIENSGLTQKQYAASVDIHPVSMSNYLNKDNFSMKALKKIADKEGVPVASLLPDGKRRPKVKKDALINGYIEYDGKIEAIKSVKDLERIWLAVNNNSPGKEVPEKKQPKTRKQKNAKEEAPQQLSEKSIKLKSELDAIIEQEHKNTEALKEHPLFYPIPTKKDLLDSKQLKYDSSKYVCVAFRSKPDHWKNLWVPLGNMNGGFDYEIGGIKVKTSEHAYILGVFSNNTATHLAIQRQVMAETRAYQAKHGIRMKNRLFSRLDWRSFKIDWMLFCVWEKIKQNEEFRNILLAIPQGATIIEDNSFKNKPDTYWGCFNPNRKPFANKARLYARSLDLPTKAAKERISNKLIWDFCNYGVFEGTNEMGRILTYLKDCLHTGTEPDIDYNLLNRKNIYLLGKEMHF